MANVYVLLGEGCGDIKDTAEFLLKEGKNRFSNGSKYFLYGGGSPLGAAS